jgi:hypothetical protein
MKFDLVVTNPPFQDTGKRGKTPHKLWIEFTRLAFERWLVDDGFLAQVSPSSFRSPNSEVLELMKKYKTHLVNFDSGLYFPGVGSSFSDYIVQKQSRPEGHQTVLRDGAVQAVLELDDQLLYLPNRLDQEAFSIHKKVIFSPPRTARSPMGLRDLPQHSPEDV